MIKDIDMLMDKINFLSIQQYLSSQDWEKVLSKKQDKAFFRKTIAGKMFEILVPLSRDFSDYKYAIQKAVKNIANIENKDEHQLLNDLISPPADTIRFRVSNPRTQEGLITLPEGFMLLESAKKALLTTACDIIKPELYHKRLGLKGALQFVDACMLGQTERGSFIASIVCPIGNQSINDKYTYLSLFDPVETLSNSFTRRVTQKLMLSIDKVKQAIESQRYEDIENADDFKISANFLESLLEMGEYGENEEIQIMSTWASMLPQKSSIPNSIILTKDYIPPLERMIERIKEKNADENGEFIGKISQVKADAEPTSRKDGEITFNFLGDTGLVKAKTILSKSDFDTALEAFEHGKNVKIKGVLKSSGRTKWIESQSFEVIT